MDDSYTKFLEILSTNEHPTLKYNRIQFLIFEQFYDIFHKIKDNSSNLKIHPDDYNKSKMWQEFINETNKNN